jgi:hypothetical protein
MNKLSTIKVLRLDDETKHLWSREHYIDIMSQSISPGETYICLGISESGDKIYIINQNRICDLMYNERLFSEI